jgi:hypothetical protein
MPPPQTPSDAVLRLARTIDDYLHRHPDASDSAEGVARWWLPAGSSPAADQVLKALKVLLAEGRLVEVVLPGGRVVYARPRRPDA